MSVHRHGFLPLDLKKSKIRMVALKSLEISRNEIVEYLGNIISKGRHREVCSFPLSIHCAQFLKLRNCKYRCKIDKTSASDMLFPSCTLVSIDKSHRRLGNYDKIKAHENNSLGMVKGPAFLDPQTSGREV